MILAEYNLFARRKQQYEILDGWYCESTLLYDLAEAVGMSGEYLLTVMITL